MRTDRQIGLHNEKLEESTPTGMVKIIEVKWFNGVIKGIKQGFKYFSQYINFFKFMFRQGAVLKNPLLA